MSYNAGELQIDIETHDWGTLVRPHGFIDLSRSPSLRTALAEVNRARPRRLVVDLSQVDYMDSSGVATFVEALQLARASGAKLVFCSMQDRVRSIFEIARLDMVFTICDDLPAAISA